MKKTLKKITIAIAFALFLFSKLFAQETEVTNNQKIWAIDSKVYTYLSYLSVIQGKSLPNSTGPWSTQELLQILSQLDSESENPQVQELYNKIYDILVEKPQHVLSDGFSFNFHGSFSPEMYIHTNPQDFNDESDWNYDFTKRNKLISLETDFYASKNFYFYTNMFIGYASYINCGKPELTESLYSPNFMSNIPFLPIQDLGFLDVNFPYRSFVSAGGDHWSFSFGRDIISWGNGESGNLFLGGNAPYDNYLRFCVFYNIFKFSTLVITYPHDQNYTRHSQNSPINGTKFFLAHRLDFKFLQNRINLSATEAIMYQSASSTIDINYFNPMYLYHNFFIRGNSNSIMSVETDFAVTNHLNIYSQIALDEIAFGEPTGEDSEGGHPSKMGYMLGTKFIYPTNLGILKLNLEGVYTDPFLYLREKYDPNKEIYGVSLYGYTREFNNHSRAEYIRRCLGYKYGGDCIVADFKAALDGIGKWEGGLELFYMAHGIMYNDLNSDWILGRLHSPSTSDKQVYEKSLENCPTNPDGFVEHFVRASINGNYQFLDWLNVYAGLDNWFIWNKNNQEAPMVYDLQLYTGVEFRF